MISASIKSTLGEAKHEVMIVRQEEKNFELLRSVEGKLRLQQRPRNEPVKRPIGLARVR